MLMTHTVVQVTCSLSSFNGEKGEAVALRKSDGAIGINLGSKNDPLFFQPYEVTEVTSDLCSTRNSGIDEKTSQE